MQRAILGKTGSEAAPQLQGQIARAFSSNGLVNTMEMTAATQYILTAAQSLGSQDYFKKSRMTILREHSTNNFQKHLIMSLKFTTTGELACHCITAFSGKLKGVLHIQEDGTNIFPSHLNNMTELCVFHHEHP